MAEKLLHERLKDLGFIPRITLHGISGRAISLLNHEAKDLADEIERDYIPRKAYEAEVKRIIEAQKDSARHTMKIYAEEKGMPMQDGENITEWLDRRFIKRPCFEDGEPVQFGDDSEDGIVETIEYSKSGTYAFNPNDRFIRWRKLNEPVKRPVPEVLDADGVEIKVGDTVYSVYNGSPLTVEEVSPNYKKLFGEDGVCCGGGVFFNSTMFTHEKPVFDADSERIRKGDTVWGVTSGCKFQVIGIPDQYQYPTVDIRNVETGSTGGIDADKLTHREPDSLEKLRDDIQARANELESTPYLGVQSVSREWAGRLTTLIERGV